MKNDDYGPITQHVNEKKELWTRISLCQDVKLTVISLAPPPVNEVPTNEGDDSIEVEVLVFLSDPVHI